MTYHLSEEKLKEICRCGTFKKTTYLYWVLPSEECILRAEAYNTYGNSIILSMRRFTPKKPWGIGSGSFSIEDNGELRVTHYRLQKTFNYFNIIERNKTLTEDDMWPIYIEWLHSLIGKCVSRGIDLSMEEFQELLKGTHKGREMVFRQNLVRIYNIIDYICDAISEYEKLTGEHIWFSI